MSFWYLKELLADAEANVASYSEWLIILFHGRLIPEAEQYLSSWKLDHAALPVVQRALKSQPDTAHCLSGLISDSP